jgi:hypothetical protein
MPFSETLEAEESGVCGGLTGLSCIVGTATLPLGLPGEPVERLRGETSLKKNTAPKQSVPISKPHRVSASAEADRFRATRPGRVGMGAGGVTGASAATQGRFTSCCDDCADSSAPHLRICSRSCSLRSSICMPARFVDSLVQITRAWTWIAFGRPLSGTEIRETRLSFRAIGVIPGGHSH